MVQNQLSEEYARQDNEKMINQNGGTNRIVYDCVDQSPYYSDPQDPYIEDIDLIELPSDDNNGGGGPDQRKYPYGSTYPQNSGMLTNFNNRGLRINRFY